MEKEVDKLGVEYSKIYPKTGIPEADREISKLMGPVLEDLAPRLLGSSAYKKMNEKMQKLVLGKIIGQARLRARNQLVTTNPKLAAKIKVESIPNDIKEILESMGVGINRE